MRIIHEANSENFKVMESEKNKDYKYKSASDELDAFFTAKLPEI
jgi:hypothetical protein